MSTSDSEETPEEPKRPRRRRKAASEDAPAPASPRPESEAGSESEATRGEADADASPETGDVIDETPMAYKSIDAVMEAQKDLVEIVHTLRQVVCVKG